MKITVLKDFDNFRLIRTREPHIAAYSGRLLFDETLDFQYKSTDEEGNPCFKTLLSTNIDSETVRNFLEEK